MSTQLSITLSVILLVGFAGMMTAFWIYCAKQIKKTNKDKDVHKGGEKPL